MSIIFCVFVTKILQNDYNTTSLSCSAKGIAQHKKFLKNLENFKEMRQKNSIFYLIVQKINEPLKYTYLFIDFQ